MARRAVPFCRWGSEGFAAPLYQCGFGHLAGKAGHRRGGVPPLGERLRARTTSAHQAPFVDCAPICRHRSDRQRVNPSILPPSALLPILLITSFRPPCCSIVSQSPSAIALRRVSRESSSRLSLPPRVSSDGSQATATTRTCRPPARNRRHRLRCASGPFSQLVFGRFSPTGSLIGSLARAYRVKYWEPVGLSQHNSLFRLDLYRFPPFSSVRGLFEVGEPVSRGPSSPPARLHSTFCLPFLQRLNRPCPAISFNTPARVLFLPWMFSLNSRVEISSPPVRLQVGSDVLLDPGVRLGFDPLPPLFPLLPRLALPPGEVGLLDLFGRISLLSHPSPFFESS